MAKSYLISTYGLPGSGKTTFAQQLADEYKLFYWRGDDARRHMFDHPQQSDQENQLLSRSARYAIEEALKEGLSCIYDVNLHQAASRTHLAELAAQYGAEFWLLWIQTPEALAAERVKQRAVAATGEWKDYFATLPADLIEQAKLSMEAPDPADPRLIVIDGTADYATQRQRVLSRLKL